MATRTMASDPVVGEEVDLSALMGGVDIWSEEASGKREFELLPDGQYHAQIHIIEGPTLNKAGDGYWIKPQYRIVDGEYRNRRIFDYISLKPSALWKLQQFLVAMGKSHGDVTYTPGEFDENFCTLEIGTQDASGEYKARNKVMAVHPLDESADLSDW